MHFCKVEKYLVSAEPNSFDMLDSFAQQLNQDKTDDDQSFVARMLLSHWDIEFDTSNNSWTVTPNLETNAKKSLEKIKKLSDIKWTLGCTNKAELFETPNNSYKNLVLPDLLKMILRKELTLHPDNFKKIIMTCKTFSLFRGN